MEYGKTSHYHCKKESRNFEKDILSAHSAHILQMMSKFINFKKSRERSLIINPPKYEEKVIIFYLLILSPPEEALW